MHLMLKVPVLPCALTVVVSVFASGLLSSLVTAVITGLVCLAMRKKQGARDSRNIISVPAPIYDEVTKSKEKETFELTRNVAYAASAHM